MSTNKNSVNLGGRAATAMPRRMVHLDFHTGPGITGVGEAFNPEEFARTLAEADVQSVTVFAKCHHGHLYYGTERPERHPGLANNLDLLEEQIEALHRFGIKAPVYLSVQVDEYAADHHPEWVATDEEGRLVKMAPGRFHPGWQVLDMSSPYTDYLAGQLDDVLRTLGTVDGVFLDMCWDQPSTSRWAVDGMRSMGLDVTDAADRETYARSVAHTYMGRYRAMILPRLADGAPMSVWFNSRPKTALTDEVAFVDHVEIEALPTGGWGYSYLPYVSRFVRPLGKPVLAHTGRFHKSWGDNGGLKPQAALTFECAQMLAYGISAGVGDLLHPSGRLAPDTYRLVGTSYRHIKRCEPFTEGGRHVKEVAVLLDPALGDTPGPVGVGVVRALQRLRLQFDILPPAAELGEYRAVVVPETTQLTGPLAQRLQRFAEAGGALLVSGAAAIEEDGTPRLDALGIAAAGAPVDHAFWRASGNPDAFAHVMYEPSRPLTPSRGTALWDVVAPYFPRTWDNFSGHDYTPVGTGAPLGAAVVVNGSVATVAAPLFTAVGRHAAEEYHRLLSAIFARILPDPLVRADGPAHLEAVVVDTERTRVVHLLSFLASRQGEGVSALTFAVEGIDLVHDPFPLVAMELEVKADREPASVTLQPHGHELPFTYRDGYLRTTVDLADGHGMVVLGRPGG
ncbi:alpha-amylase family protein [Streptomyces sp. NPDC004752]